MNKLEIDLYDFDKTIVPFDSGTLFILYCFVHYPWCIFFTPVIVIGFLLTLFKIISFTNYKRVCFMFVPLIPKEKAVKKFWNKYDKKVFDWFKKRERYSVVISASPDFLLGEIQKRLGFEKLICTIHNKKTGAIIGDNCRGQEKVNRLFREFKKDEIEVFDVYSDSLRHDKYIFSLANQNCYNIVSGEKIKFDYNEKFKETK